MPLHRVVGRLSLGHELYRIPLLKATPYSREHVLTPNDLRQISLNRPARTASSSPPHVTRTVWRKPVTSGVTLLTGWLQTHDPCHERSPYRRPDLATSRHRRLLTRNHLHAIGRSTLQYNITRARNTPPSLGHCSLLPQLTGWACRASPQRCSSPPGADSPNPSLSSMFDRTGALTGLASFLRCLERQMVRAQ